MRSPLPRSRALALLLASLAVSACDKQVRIEQPTPPVADVRALVEPKPAIVGDIVNDDTAAALHSSKVETWGDGLSAAGARMCRWFAETGAKLPFDCPKP